MARAVLGLGVPLGPDPAMWGLAGVQLLHGDLPEVAWGYPALTAAGAELGGMRPWQIGGVVSMIASATLSGASFEIARRCGAPRAAAALAAIVCVALPDLFGFAFHLQPDALTALGLVGVLAAGLAWAEAPSQRRALVWLAVGLALAAVREHGPIVLGATALALVATRAPRAAVALGLGAALVAVAVVWAGATDALPARVAMPLRESPLGAGGPVPSYADELGGPAGEALMAAWRAGDIGGVWLATVERLFVRSGENLLLLGLGVMAWARVAATRGNRRVLLAALVPLSPLLLLLVIWSHRRHTSVLVPVAAIGLAAAIGAAPAARRGLGVVALAGLFGLVIRTLPGEVGALAGAARHGHDRIALATWMRAQPGPWFLGGQHNEMNLHLEWPRNNPALPPPGVAMPTVWDGAAWRTQWVGPPGTMPPPLSQVHTIGSLAVFRLEPPPGETRPCTDVVHLEGPLFATEPVTGVARPPCEGTPDFRDPPPPQRGPWTGQPFAPPERPR